MTTLKSLAIVGIASLPLAVLSALAFTNSGEGVGPVVVLPSLPASVALVLDKANAELQAKAAAEAAVDADPAGFRAKEDDPVATKSPYSTAAILAEAEAATKSDDLDRTNRALAGIADNSLFPVGLQSEVTGRRQLLERHATWLRNRIVAADSLRQAAETLRAPASIDNATQAADTLRELRRRFPQVAGPNSVSDEPGDALTALEAAEASRLMLWATYRSEFLTLKAQHARLDDGQPDALKAALEAWDQFLATYDRPDVPDPDDCIAESRRVRSETRLAFLWATAIACDTPDTLAPAVLAWLDEPRSPGGGGDSDRRGQAIKLLRAWLERNLPSPPTPPGSLAEMQEGVIDDRQAGKRVIATFQAVAEQPKRYRWWYSPAERKELPLGNDSGFLQAAPTAPRCIDWARQYRKARDTYVAGFMAEESSFADECRALAEACQNHMKVPPLDPETDVTAPVAGWAEMFYEAADRATLFQRAWRDSGLMERLGKQSP